MFFAVIGIPTENPTEARDLARSMTDEDWPLLVFDNEAPVEARTLRDAENERIAVCDAWRAQMEGQGVHPNTAALIVQSALDNAPKN